MSLSGVLEDVPILQVLQFLHLSGLTGTLTVSSARGEARIGWYEGDIISAHCPNSKRRGTFLMQLGAINQQTLERALAKQKQESSALPLGAILVGMAALPRADLVEAFGRQVGETVSEVSTWRRGTFRFEIDDLEPLDDISLSPNELDVVNLGMEQSLLEAVRLLDERKRAHKAALGATRTGKVALRAAPGPVPAEPAPAATATASSARGASSPRVRLLSRDASLVHSLEPLLRNEQVSLETSGLLEALGHATDPCPVVVDLRDPHQPLELLRALRSAQADRLLLAVADRSTPMADIYEAGASAVVTAEPTAIAACLQSIGRQRRSGARRQFADGLAAGFAKLRRLVHTVRTGALSAAAPLDLLQLLADSVDRGVFLLVDPAELACLGAFGADPEGRPLVERVRGLRLKRATAGALERCAQGAEGRSYELGAARLPAAFTDRIGLPTSGRCAVFPAVGSGRTIAVIYVDNGERDWPVEEVEFLELAAAHLGLAFENEQLRDRAAKGGD